MALSSQSLFDINDFLKQEKKEKFENSQSKYGAALPIQRKQISKEIIRTCRIDFCSNKAEFNFRGKKRPLYCNKHKLKCMI